MPGEGEVPGAGLRRGDDGVVRCWWSADDEAYRRYHDEEWGVPVGDDRAMFELLCLEGFQAGLSWLTILRKREAFRRAFAGFDPARVAAFDDDDDVARLLADASIVRNRAKVEATIGNARRAVELAAAGEHLAALVWRHEPPPQDRPPTVDEATVRGLVSTPASTALSRELKERGWRFVGPTTIYALLQSAGVVNDHVEGCDRRAACEAARDAFPRPGAAATGR